MVRRQHFSFTMWHMTDFGTTARNPERLDISIGTPGGDTRRAVPNSDTPAPVTGSAGFQSGHRDFDQLLERLHAAFGEFGKSGTAASAATDAASGLAARYRSITGRNRPEADDDAGELLTSVNAGLLGSLTSLTDFRGQNMLRLLA